MRSVAVSAAPSGALPDGCAYDVLVESEAAVRQMRHGVAGDPWTRMIADVVPMSGASASRTTVSPSRSLTGCPVGGRATARSEWCDQASIFRWVSRVSVVIECVGLDGHPRVRAAGGLRTASRVQVLSCLGRIGTTGTPRLDDRRATIDNVRPASEIRHEIERNNDRPLQLQQLNVQIHVALNV